MMAIFKKYGKWIFAAILLIHCVFIYLGDDQLRTVSKLFLLPVLMLYLAASREKGNGPVNLLVYFGLLFSFLGDLILSRSGETMFLFGMLAFIGTHVCNSIYFVRLQNGNTGKGKEILFAFLILAVVSSAIFWILKPYLGNFQIPILFYMVIISVMAILATATIRNPALITITSRYFIPGAALFVLSDGTLAMNKFLLHQSIYDIVVMLTYGAAQYFLVSGFIRVGQSEKL